MKKHTQNSLSEVHESVIVPAKASSWRRWLAITGPALMVSVGYMDPGNWATDIAGEAAIATLWICLIDVKPYGDPLQSLAARLGIVSRRDLAQVCHEDYLPIVNIPLYILAEIVIVTCDLAEAFYRLGYRPATAFSASCSSMA
ncbi:MAG: divalent metal cation transporter [Anaerolineales bacterium]